MQSRLEDALFLGKEYEEKFDQLEALLSLAYADLDVDDGHFWGPLGRFAYKYRRSGSGALSELFSDAERQGDRWPPLVAGLFGGNAEEFKVLAEKYAEFMGKLNWH